MNQLLLIQKFRLLINFCWSKRWKLHVMSHTLFNAPSNDLMLKLSEKAGDLTHNERTYNYIAHMYIWIRDQFRMSPKWRKFLCQFICQTKFISTYFIKVILLYHIWNQLSYPQLAVKVTELSLDAAYVYTCQAWVVEWWVVRARGTFAICAVMTK